MRQIVFYAVSLLCAGSVQAASFDCAKAKSAVEKAICADTQINGLDGRLGKAYSKLLKTLPKDEAAEVKKNQRVWLQQRDSQCAPDFTAECMLPLYQQQATVLEFRLSPDYADSPAAEVGGEYTMGEVMSMQVRALAADRVAVEISGAEPTRGRWICQFSGEGEIGADGTMTITPPEDDKPIAFTFKDDTAQIDEGEGISYYCGAGGTLSGEYDKRE